MNMKRIVFFSVVAIFILGVSCGSGSNKTNETVVSLKTEFGDIKIKLYDDTPKHRDNFIKLVNEGFYNDLLFHRVIENFMIQGGDPNSKDAKPGEALGGGSPGYTIPAEMNTGHFHKKGALAAARIGGPRNPDKESSGSQFYIVQGRVFRPGELDTLEFAINAQRQEALMKEQFNLEKSKFDEVRGKNDPAAFNILIAELREKVDSMYKTKPQYVISEERRKVYTTVGGYPSLDHEYTVFGEVIEGLDVVEKIAAVNVDGKNRPLKDIRMEIELDK